MTNVYGYVSGRRFIVDKFPQHVFKAYNGFGLNEKRLHRLFNAGLSLQFFCTTRSLGLRFVTRFQLRNGLKRAAIL